MSLIEIAMALSLLSLIAVMLVGSINVISRRDVNLVNQRATANGLAVRYLEMQRAQVRVSSLQALENKAMGPDTIDGVEYRTTITIIQGRILLASEVIGGVTVLPGKFVVTDDGEVYKVDEIVAPNAAVQVNTTVVWGTAPKEQSVTLQSIMVPREN